MVLFNSLIGAFIYPLTDLCVTPKSKVYVKCLAPFCEEISGMTIANFLGSGWGD